MDREEAARALELLTQVVRQVRDDTTLQNWGAIWIVHGFTNGAAFLATQWLAWRPVRSVLPYVSLWGATLAVNVLVVFLLKSRTAGARTFVETQIWAIWLTFVAAVVLVAFLNHVMAAPPFALAPVVAVLSAVAFAAMGGVMGRRWYAAAAVFAATSMAMAFWPRWQFAILGVVWGIGQVTVGGMLQRQKRRRLAAGPSPRLV